MTTNLAIEQVKQLPTSPGVYLMRDDGGTIMYVGKAANLRHRVRSYFGSGNKLSPKTRRMVARVNDLDFYVTSSEQEALILESTLVKRHHPQFNVLLKDDKTFPYLKIETNTEWPRVFVTRRLEEDGGQYFGPFASARSVRRAMKVLKGIFPFRSCTRDITGKDRRPCLNYYIHRCLGPCTGATSQSEYAGVIRQVVLFLEGKQGTIVREMERKMRKASDDFEFEKAAVIRDQIQAIERVIEGQQIATRVRGEQDVIAFAVEKNHAYVQVFFIRGGKLIGRDSFVLQGTSSEEPRQIMTSFVKQFYASALSIPPLLLLQHPLEDKQTIEAWLHDKRGSKVTIQVPSRGSKKQLVDIVAENAEQGRRQHKVRIDESASALAEIQRELRLPRLPERIEGYDISNIQGTSAVGSMVVFEKGKPQKSHYRRFRIKTVSGADDYAMLREVLGRRFRRSRLGDSSGSGGWAVIPDLVLIDGGKGQLNAALAEMEASGAGLVPVAGLAKENEEIFIPGRAEPVVLPESSPAMQLLQRIRDEAHRFALGYHHNIHRRKSLASALDNVPGIGTNRRRTLLKQFGSVRAIREASLQELVATRGINPGLARKIKEYL